MKFYYLCLLISIQLIAVKSNEENNELVFVKDVEDEQTTDEKFKVSDEVFIPTNEWQTLKKDQGIPKGLHVRLNVQTGEREAKLLEGTEYIDGRVVDAKTIVTRAQEKIREALKQLNDDKLNLDDEDKVQEIKNKFRSYEELKQDVKSLNLTMHTDSELIKDLTNQFNTSNDKNEKLRILNDLEYYVHRFDNGLLLCDMGGFEMIMKELNTTQDKELQMQTALVLGSAMQSNPKVKVHAIKFDLLQLILNHISNSLNDLDMSNQDFVSKLLFTLSSVLRHFPFAQSQFIRFGGVEILNKVLMSQFYTNKLKIKVLTLANDLILEKSDSNQQLDNNLKQEQYNQVNLLEKLKDSNWCNSFDTLLGNTKKDEHDSIEKITDSILNLVEDCISSFKPSLIESLKKLNKNYENLAKEETDDNYFSNIFIKIKKILEILKTNHNIEL